jgi:catechol 2,3-dioxygenase-like lactoylglutathione lyase family enzyme
MRLSLLFSFAIVLSLPLFARAADNELTADERAAGFQLLFDGKSLDGWQGSVKGYEAKDGTIVCKPNGGGFLYTGKEYGDFTFRFDFKLTPGANNGVGLRTPMGGDPAYVGMESQILDNTANQYKNLAPYQYHGSIYGVAPAVRNRQKPVGEWNSEEITCQGKHVTVKLNGYTIVSVNIQDASNPKTMDGKAHPGLERAKGYICFCGHGAHVEFKNIRVRELPGEEFAKTTFDLGCVVKDIEKSVAFYKEAIGMTEQPGFSAPGSFVKDVGLADGNNELVVRVMVLGEGAEATKLKLIQAPAGLGKPGDSSTIDAQLGYRYITIMVKDMQAALARLETAGVKPLAKGPVELPAALAKGVYLTVVRDPDGNMVELVGPKAE